MELRMFGLEKAQQDITIVFYRIFKKKGGGVLIVSKWKIQIQNTNKQKCSAGNQNTFECYQKTS